MILSLVELNLCLICESEVPMPVCILGNLAYFNASPAIFISFSTALERAQTVVSLIIFEISTTELKSPGLDTGKPASITSTPRFSNFSAITTFCVVLSLQPGTCSPSLNVVSNI